MKKNDIISDIDLLKGILERNAAKLDKLSKQNNTELNAIYPDLVDDLKKHIKESDFSAIKEKFKMVHDKEKEKVNNKPK